jgi:hypothetical protein
MNAHVSAFLQIFLQRHKKPHLFFHTGAGAEAAYKCLHFWILH